MSPVRPKIDTGKEELMAQQDITVDAARLQDFVTRALKKVWVPEDDARITADMLVTTDLRGIESHGVAHLAQFYVGGDTSRPYQSRPQHAFHVGGPVDRGDGRRPWFGVRGGLSGNE